MKLPLLRRLAWRSKGRGDAAAVVPSDSPSDACTPKNEDAARARMAGAQSELERPRGLHEPVMAKRPSPPLINAGVAGVDASLLFSFST